MMRGYYRDSVATARVLDSDGWFYTGDLGTLDEEGMLRLAGRKDDLILRAGQNVYPAEVERYLESHPKVRRAGVVGAPGPLGSVAIWAFVERQPGATLTTQELRDYCRGQIAPFKIPESVRFVERLPVTVSNKLQRYQLRAWAAQDAHVLFEGIADDATALV
jgi:fatty-acyl-CoA synthase